MKHGNKPITMVQAAVIAVTAGILSGGAWAGSMSGEALLMFDDNRDAQVTAQEFTDEMGVMFGQMDVDGNGTLGSDEVTGIIDADLFEGADANKDGTLSRAEFDAQIKRDFEAADKDGDGVLD